MTDFTDLVQRLEEANRSLLRLADERRDLPAEADRLEAKANGVRLALAYVYEAQRLARWTT